MVDEMMDVLRLHGVGDLRLQSEPIKEPAPREVLLRVSAVGICGSDLHWLEEAGIGDAQVIHPLVLGHEFSAVVESDNSPLYKQRVAVDPCPTRTKPKLTIPGQGTVRNAIRLQSGRCRRSRHRLFPGPLACVIP